MDTDDIYEIPYKTFDYHYVHLHESIIMYRYIFTSQSLRTSTSSRVNHYVHLHESIITYIFTSQSLDTSSRVKDFWSTPSTNTVLFRTGTFVVMRLDSMEIRLSFNQSRNVYWYILSSKWKSGITSYKQLQLFNRRMWQGLFK